jgi:putative transposase
VVHQLWESNAPHDGHEGTDHYEATPHTPEQIVRKLREGDRLLNEGKDITEVVRHLEIAESTWNRWRAQYGGMKAKRLRQLETENAKLKKLMAEAELDKAMLKELAEGNCSGSRGRRNAALSGRAYKFIEASAGVFQPRVLRGCVLSVSATASRSFREWREKSVPLGKYWRSRPFVFSLVPRCHGLCGSQK